MCLHPVFEQILQFCLVWEPPFLLSIPVENEGALFIISDVGDLTQGLKGAKNRLYH